MSEPAPTHRQAWDSSAVDYATFASQSPIYQDTAAALVDLAGIKAGMTVVDLACGSGVVTDAILRRAGKKRIRVIAADFSAAMIAVARARILSPRVTFHCTAAENFSQVVEGRVDRVLCNAAFWQFDQERTLDEIARVLKPSGKCLLTIPDRSGFIDELDVQYDKHKLLWMMREEMLIRGYRSRTRALRAAAAGPDAPAQAEGIRLTNDRLRVQRIEQLLVNATAQDHFEFLGIPVMTRQFSASCGVPEHELPDILNVVRNQLDWVDVRIPPQGWKVVVLTRAD